jgi:AP-1 complex subunit beta-1
VYHKPPEAFLGQGRFGAEAMQRAAIEEQEQEVRENPIAAAAAAAAVSGKAPHTTNMENLLDIDFDGSAPASMQKPPHQGESGLEGLAGTPQRVASPASNAPAQPPSNMDDLLGLFGDGGGAAPPAGAQMSNDDIMNGFADMSIQNSQPPPPQQQLGGEASKKSNQDLLDLF